MKTKNAEYIEKAMGLPPDRGLDSSRIVSVRFDYERGTDFFKLLENAGDPSINHLVDPAPYLMHGTGKVVHPTLTVDYHVMEDPREELATVGSDFILEDFIAAVETTGLLPQDRKLRHVREQDYMKGSTPTRGEEAISLFDTSTKGINAVVSGKFSVFREEPESTDWRSLVRVRLGTFYQSLSSFFTLTDHDPVYLTGDRIPIDELDPATDEVLKAYVMNLSRVVNPDIFSASEGNFK